MSARAAIFSTSYLKSSGFWAAVFSLYFLAAALVLIPYFGIQNDEALFAAGIYPPESMTYNMRLGDRQIPAMLMSYLGAPKTWFFTRWFKRWGPSAYSMRLPPTLAGIGLIWLLLAFLRRTSGGPAPLVACALLAADTTFLLTNVFDWGPVAIQHLALLGGLLLVVRFHQTQSLRALAGGFFLFGLGLWDKAVFAWALGGLAAAGLAVYGREIRRAISPRTAAIALLAGSLGGLPLIVYNYASNMETLRSTLGWTAEGWIQKAWVLRDSLEGSALFDYMSRTPEASGVVLEPRTLLERSAGWITRATGEVRHGFLGIATLAGFLLLPFGKPTRRLRLFAALFLVVTWGQMLVIKDAGGGAHHTVLLWPFPHILAALTLAEFGSRLGRFSAAAITLGAGLIAGSNFLVANTFFSDAIRYGTTVTWTDAIYPLSEFCKKNKAPQYVIMDWGMADGLRALNRGRLGLPMGSDLVSPAPTPADGMLLLIFLSEPANLFICHREGEEFMEGMSGRLRAAAAAAGFEREMVATIPDRNGRPIFEIFRFRRAT